MSGGVTNSLSREKIEQLLTAVGSQPMEDTTQAEATDYNWHEPHYFNSEQLVRLGYFTESVAVAVAQKFTKLCRSECDVTITSTTQHYAYEFLSQLSESEQRDYYLPFGTDPDHMCGLIGIPGQAAVSWATQLLGDAESEMDPGGDLSPLEESLLLDMASALVEVFSGSDKALTFQPGQNIVRGQLPLGLGDTEELCKISFDVKNAESEKSSGAYFLILCSKLTSVAGKAVQDTGKSAAEDLSKVILGHLERMPVLVTGQLASAVLTFEEIMNLQVDDVLLLDKRVNQPAELFVGGRAIYYGWPAKSAGRYAVAITSTATALGDTDEKTNPGIGTK